MIILGIETSCDETAAALVQDGVKIISNVVASSQELHIKTKGVIPEVAAREQVKCVIPVIKEALNNCYIVKLLNCSKNNPEDFIDAIAVTVGPGLIGSLLVGVETAKTLAYVWKKPIVPVNHLVGHVYANFVRDIKKCHPELNFEFTRNQACLISGSPLKQYEMPKQVRHDYFTKIFPAIVLIVSGGHTELLLMTGHGKFKWLGGTRDDAAGECFDKCARILGLPYPGGPSIEKIAKSQKLKAKSEIILPRPMIDQDNFDFSFSGLKTALVNLMKKPSITQLLNYSITPLAFEVQEAISDVLVDKTIKAAEKYRVKSIILGGGVAANQRLREKFQEEIKKVSASWRIGVNFLCPPPKLCTDNAVGIASAAYFNFKPVPWSKITATAGLEIV